MGAFTFDAKFAANSPIRARVPDFKRGTGISLLRTHTPRGTKDTSCSSTQDPHHENFVVSHEEMHKDGPLRPISDPPSPVRNGTMAYASSTAPRGPFPFKPTHYKSVIMHALTHKSSNVTGLLGKATQYVPQPQWNLTKKRHLPYGNLTKMSQYAVAARLRLLRGRLQESMDAPSTASEIRGVLQDLRTMTLPLLMVWLSSPLLSLIDTIAVGRGPGGGLLHLAALGPAVSVCDTGTYVLSFLSITTTSVVANALVKKNYRRERAAVEDAVTSAVLIGGLWTAVISSFMGGAIIDFFSASAGGGSASATLSAIALSYSRIRAIGFIPALVMCVLQAACLARRNVRLPLLAVAVASIFNLATDWILVMKMGLGAAGAAWATVIAQVCACSVLIRGELKYRKKTETLMPKRLDNTPRPSRTRAARAKGVKRFMTSSYDPLMALTGKAAVSSLLTATVAGACSTAALAAHQVLYSVYCLFCPMGEALSQTVQSLLPSALGSTNATSTAAGPSSVVDDPDDDSGDTKPSRVLTHQAWSLVRAVSVTGFALGTIDALCGGAIPRFLPNLFTNSPAVAAAMVSAAPLVAGSLALHALTNMLEGILFATRDNGFFSNVYTMNSLLMMGIFALMRSHSPSLEMVWLAYLGYQGLRFAECLIRVAMNQRTHSDEVVPKPAKYTLAYPVASGAAKRMLLDFRSSPLEHLQGAWNALRQRGTSQTEDSNSDSEVAKDSSTQPIPIKAT